MRVSKAMRAGLDILVVIYEGWWPMHHSRMFDYMGFNSKKDKLPMEYIMRDFSDSQIKQLDYDQLPVVFSKKPE